MWYASAMAIYFMVMMNHWIVSPFLRQTHSEWKYVLALFACSILCRTVAEDILAGPSSHPKK
jgi:uncharacterized membrane protein